MKNLLDFSSLLEQEKSTWARANEWTTAKQAEMESLVQADYKKLYPRRKYDFLKAVGTETGKAIRDKINKEAEAFNAERWAEIKAIRAAIDAMAQEIAIQPTENVWTRVYSVSDYDYNTQGWGAAKYARGSADNQAMHYVSLGFETIVRTVKYIEKHAYVVWINADPITAKIAEKKPGVSLKEWVRACLKRGTNIRVLNPYLPYGLEEKLGLDYFGNDLRKAS